MTCPHCAADARVTRYDNSRGIMLCSTCHASEWVAMPDFIGYLLLEYPIRGVSYPYRGQWPVGPEGFIVAESCKIIDVRPYRPGVKVALSGARVGDTVAPLTVLNLLVEPLAN